MASHFDDPEQWRLKTKKGIRFKLVTVDLNYQTTRAEGSIEIIIATADLQKFLEEILPPPKKYKNIYIPQYTRFSNTTLAVTSVGVRSFDDGMPIDPFSADKNAPDGTYYPTLTLVLGLAVPPDGDQDPDKPESYLEISSDASGDFIHTPPANMEYQDVDSDGKGQGNKEKVRNPLVPHAILCPQVTWNVKWKNVPFDSYQKTYVGRLESALGKCNSEPFKPLSVTYKEVLLLLTYSIERSYTWREKFTDIPMVDITMKFLEKKIIWEGKPHGHNSQWIPGTGWRRLLMDGKPTFETSDFNEIFSQTT